MQIGKTVCGTFNTCKAVFSLSTASTFPYILVPIWSLSLTGWEVLSWDSAGASAPIKAHHRFVSRKTSYLGQFFSLVVTYQGFLMLLTICSAEPYLFHKQQLRSNIVLILGPFIPSPDQIFQGKMVRADHFSWNFCPPDQFFSWTKISVTVLFDVQ